MERTNEMITETNIITTIVSKPMVGVGASFGSGVAGLLYWAGIITPIAACIGAIIGAIVGAIHLGFLIRKIVKGKMDE